MKYIKQFAIILTITCIGEILKYLIDLPIPGSIHGLIIMFLLLLFHVLKPEDVKETGEFLIEIMPLMFIPAGAGLLSSFDVLKEMLIPLLVIIPLTTCMVVFVSGRVTEAVLHMKGGKKNV